MCTVSFIPRKDSFVITSNRDEHISRSPAYKPKVELINGLKVVFPKDPKAGGTWFAVNEKNVAVVLLNGAFENHKSTGNYEKSRGLVVLDIVGHHNPQIYLEETDLMNIEPFTVIVVEKGKVVELRWDGKDRFIELLDSSESYIWSSATLYSKMAINKREELFSKFIDENDINTSTIIDFHSNNHQDFQNGFVIDRASGLKTFSVTQAVLGKEKICLKHINLLKDDTNTVELPVNQLMNQF
ncbi:NRDE family protein [Croceitalea sp. MTPC9]|uniref:NRDE family protein n=1 Tax=unclassified Croceitalea TaxID=2632280 RepID=UPI002B3B623E|nr:NRDE family protein [Croceitalea sp. MTPC6]GMN18413.1 NRDE family protein [Croceitalea sp. MTPC9]